MKYIVLTGNCSAKGCDLLSVRAERVSDFWIERCQRHTTQNFDLDMTKIGLYFTKEDLHALADSRRSVSSYTRAKESKKGKGGKA